MNTQSIFKAAFAITAPKVATHAPAVIDSMSTEHTQGQWDKYAASRAKVQTTTAKLAAAARTRIETILTRDQSEDRGKPHGLVVGYEHPEWGTVYYVQAPQGFRTSIFAKSAKEAGDWLANQTTDASEGTPWEQEEANLLAGQGYRTIRPTRKDYEVRV